MDEYYNSIQDGACCPECFRATVDQGLMDRTIIAISEQFRFGAAQVISRVKDHIDGIQDPSSIEDGYVDRVILHVTDGSDPDYLGTRELIIISASLTKEQCFCTK